MKNYDVTLSSMLFHAKSKKELYIKIVEHFHKVTSENIKECHEIGFIKIEEIK